MSARQCDDHGLDVDARLRRLRGGTWRRVTTGVYDTGAGSGTASQTIAERQLRGVHLAMLMFGPGAIAVGSSSLLLHGNGGLPRDVVPSVALESGHPRRARAGVRVCGYRGFEIVHRGGHRCAAPAFAVVQAAPDLDRLHMLAVLDSALETGALPDLAAVLTLVRGRRGGRVLRECALMATGRAESFLETWARLQCIDAGLPPDALQLPIRDGAGRIVARGDLAWRLPGERWLIVEIDGVNVHGAPDAVFRDRARQNFLLSSGRYTVLRFTAADLARRGEVPARIRAALRRLRREAPSS